MGAEIYFAAAVLLLVCVTGNSANVVIVKPVNKTVSVFENDDVLFECKHHPNDSVEWFRSGMRLQNTIFDAERFSIYRDDQRTTDGSVISRLKVKKISRTEGGTYKCSNADFEKALFEVHQTDEVNVKVIKVGTVVHVKGPANDTVQEGDNLLLICSADIAADLVWLFKGERLAADPDGYVTLTSEETIEKGHRQLALTRRSVTEEEEGLYTCQDQIHRKQTSILVIVEEMVKVVIVQPVNKTITVSEGGDVVFECQHGPRESVEWFRSGMRISADTSDPNRFSIEADGMGTSILTVSNISRMEAGAYKCSNANLEKALFRDGQTDTLNVKVIQVDAVVHIEGPTHSVVSQGHDLLLICTGDMTSALTWHFKGHPLTTKPHGQLIITPVENSNTGQRRSVLTRSRATAEHAGLYHCYDQVNNQQASVAIKVATSDGGNQVQLSSTLLAVTALSAAVVLAIISV